MARTNKKGIDYFSCDVDFFEDDKIRLIEAEFGHKGGYVAMRLLCKIYKEGYFYQWGEDECLLFAKNIGAEFVPSAVNEVVKGLVRRCFFDKGCFDTFGILTSKGIQKRYLEATVRYKEVKITKEYWLTELPENRHFDINSINANSNAINVCINSINVDINSQIKGKEIKENINTSIYAKEKEKNANSESPNIATPATLEERKQKFREDCRVFVGEKFSNSLLYAFFNYWTETKPNGRKMRFEMEKTFEINLRLHNWLNNEQRFGNKGF